MSTVDNAILVIGGGGFIGRAVCARLATDGWDVHAVLREAASSGLEGVSHHVGSMADRDFIAPLLDLCPTVIHAASRTTPGSSSRAPAAELQNLEASLRFLEIARDKPPRRVIFLSSGGTVYADLAGRADETMATTARSYHGAGKIALEAFFRTFAWDAGCGLVTLRPSNVFGPGQPMRRGFGFVRAALECALRGDTLEIWGDGSAVRDFLYIDDLVDALVATLGSPAAEGVFNVASGAGHCLNEVVDVVRRVSDRSLVVLRRPGRKSDVHAVQLDIGRIVGVTGWRPRVDLEEGLSRTWRWVQNLS